MPAAKKVASLSAVSLAAPQQYVPNYQNPAYQQLPQYRQVAPVSQSPAQHYQQQPQSGGTTRRTFLKLVAAGGIAAIASVAIGALPSPHFNQTNVSNPNDYKGTVGSRMKSDEDGEFLFYEDLCHTADEGRSTATATIFGIILYRGSYRCSPSEGIITSDMAYFAMAPDRAYPIEGGGSMYPEDIFSKSSPGKTATFRKGKKIMESGWWLDRVVEL